MDVEIQFCKLGSYHMDLEMENRDLRGLSMQDHLCPVLRLLNIICWQCHIFGWQFTPARADRFILNNKMGPQTVGISSVLASPSSVSGVVPDNWVVSMWIKEQRVRATRKWRSLRGQREKRNHPSLSLIDSSSLELGSVCRWHCDIYCGFTHSTLFNPHPKPWSFGLI